MSHVLDIKNVWREKDLPQETQAELYLQTRPCAKKALQVPKILEG